MDWRSATCVELTTDLLFSYEYSHRLYNNRDHTRNMKPATRSRLHLLLWFTTERHPLNESDMGLWLIVRNSENLCRGSPMPMTRNNFCSFTLGGDGEWRSRLNYFHSEIRLFTSRLMSFSRERLLLNQFLIVFVSVKLCFTQELKPLHPFVRKVDRFVRRAGN